MAFSNPEIYLSDLARPMCMRFYHERTSYELAVSSCIILYHFSDVLAHVREWTPSDASKFITRRIPKFVDIRALANAGKHVEITRHENAAYRGLRAEHLTKGLGAAFSDGSFFSDGSSFDDGEETIVVIVPGGQKLDVLHTCMSVLADLEQQADFFHV